MYKRQPPKVCTLHDSARFGILCVKIRSGVWPVGWAKKKKSICIYVCKKKNDSSKKRTSPQKTPVNRSPPNLAYWVPSPTWSSMPIFLAIGLGVLNLWGVEFCHCPISRRSPLTQCWRYRSQKEPLLSHESPSRIWEKVGVDIFTFHGHDYLITVDYLSNYFEIDRLPSKKIPDVIYVLKQHFARYGVPSVVFSDGAFACQEFQKFADSYEFEHHTSSRDSHPRMESRRILLRLLRN